MTTKRFKTLKNLSKDELLIKIRELETSFFQARMRQAIGQLENTASLWQLRKDLARAKTLQTTMEHSSTKKT